jgi:cyanophycinase
MASGSKGIVSIVGSLVLMAGCAGADAMPGSASEGTHESVATAAAPDALTAAATVVVGRKLMIIGNMDGELIGSVSRDAILTDRLIADVGGPARLHVLVVPAASASPAWLGGYLQGVLAVRGVQPSQVDVAHIASEDDDTTPDVDESSWSKGASQPSEVRKLANANVVFFAGGDQDRLTSLLLTARGRDTPFEAALKARLANGRVIVAGYSAGAAVFSDPMIGSGTSFGALGMPPSTDPTCESGGDAICVAPGLGFVAASDNVIVDQHFAERGRFARLVRALALTNQKTGWGVSANGAFYVDLDSRTAEVVGNPGDATVTIIGREGARKNHEQAGPPFLGDGYTVSVLGTGDVYTLPDAGHPHGLASHLEASEVYAPFSQYLEEPPVFTDAFGTWVLPEKITEYFADGSPRASGARVDAIAFTAAEDGSAAGFRLRFTQAPSSTVAWNGDTGYSIFDARLAITTISAQFDGIGP